MHKTERMNFRLIGIITLFVTQSVGYAQDAADRPAGQADTLQVEKDTTYWAVGGLNTITFSQVSLTNWSAGGQNSIAINTHSGLFADYNKKRHSWENSLDLGYGLIKQGNEEDDVFNKSDDKINFVTKYGYQIKSGNSRWLFSALLDFRTQFTKGFAKDDPDSVISKFMAPGYLVVGMGIDYKPSKILSINYVPLTGKFTFVNDQRLADLGAYGVDPGKRSRAELGSYFRVKFKNEIFENVNLDSRLELFANYIENFGNIDVNWQNGLVMKINKVLTANFFTHLIYDDDIKIEIDNDNDGTPDEVGPRVQFKSVFGVGLGYNFGAQRDKK